LIRNAVIRSLEVLGEASKVIERIPEIRPPLEIILKEEI